jgi:hypothetical protein
VESIEPDDIGAAAGALVFPFTLVLTADPFGMLALVRGEAAGIGDRLPLCVPATAVVFVLAPLSFGRRSGVDDATILSTATATAPLDSVFVALGGGRGFHLRGPLPGTHLRRLVRALLLAAVLVTTGIG